MSEQPCGSVEPGEAAEETWLDGLLLGLLAGDGDALAEVFRERRERRSWRIGLGPEGAWQAPPVFHRDAGLAMRRLSREALLSGHVSLARPGEVEALVGRLGGQAPPIREVPESPAGEEQEAEARADADRRLVDQAAAFLAAELRSEPRLVRLSLSLTAERRETRTLSSEWGHAASRRDWRVLDLSLELEDGARRARARRGTGWPAGAPSATLGALVEELLAAARGGLEAEPVEAGSPTVLIAAGTGGVLFHEAVGHALEADVVARSRSLLGARRGERVASEHVTILDDPSLPERAGSGERDDEGIAARPVRLVERGVVGELLVDGRRGDFRIEALSGHGRRASHRDLPLPRMTNTYLAAGPESPEALRAAIRTGVLVERLREGSFDPASGQFRLRVTEARRIEAGRLAGALRPFTLEGDTLSLLAGIDGVGADLAWDDGCGTCGREGQWLPVATGQPTLRVRAGSLRVS